MRTSRLEVRLDEERRHKLDLIAADRGVPVSSVVRDLIDEAYKEVDRAARLRAVEEMARSELEDVPDPDTLSRQLEGTYDVDLY